jgi:hypothetical protein
MSKNDVSMFTYAGYCDVPRVSYCSGPAKQSQGNHALQCMIDEGDPGRRKSMPESEVAYKE